MVASPPYRSEFPICFGNLPNAVWYASIDQVNLNPSSREPLDNDIRNIWIVGQMKKTTSQSSPGASRR